MYELFNYYNYRYTFLMANVEILYEREVLLQLSNGCEEAFEKIYYHYSPRLYFKLIKVLKSESLVNELMQEIFLVIWKNRHTIDVNKSFRSYIYCIAANKACDYFRKSVRDQKLHDQIKSNSQQCDGVESEIIRKENSRTLYQAIDMLPPKRKQVFMLCKVQGKSYDEVSNQLGISSSTISDHIVKANHFLKQHLSDMDQ